MQLSALDFTLLGFAVLTPSFILNFRKWATSSITLLKFKVRKWQLGVNIAPRTLQCGVDALKVQADADCRGEECIDLDP